MNINKTLLNNNLCQAQADNLVYELDNLRVWQSRIDNSYSAELYINDTWERISCVEKTDSVQILTNEEVLGY